MNTYKAFNLLDHMYSHGQYVPKSANLDKKMKVIWKI